MKRMLRISQRIWLISMLAALAVVHALFPSTPESEVVGTFAFVVFALCIPLSFVGYALAATIASWFEPSGLFPHNSRLVLTLWWSSFLMVGAVQWYFVPWLWSRIKAQPTVQADGPASGGPAA